MVVHAATKYIGGHGTSIGGVIVDSGNFDWAAHADRFPGLTQPDGAYHGVVWTEAVGNLAYIVRARTVLLRNTGAADRAAQLVAVPAGARDAAPADGAAQRERAGGRASTSTGHDAVSWVSYPGLDVDAVPRRSPTGPSPAAATAALVSFGVKAGREGGRTFIEALELFSHLANIGDAKSLAIHNATTTHSQLTPEELEAAGVPEDMVRLSVGHRARRRHHRRPRAGPEGRRAEARRR